MAKLNLDPIKAEDLSKYLNECSDFAFEQRVFQSLRKARYQAQHSGTYSDPATGIPREYDIRASKKVIDRWETSSHQFIRIAVECKNIAPWFPLLVECVPRSRDERFHDIVVNVAAGEWRTIRVKSDSIYKEGDSVGKTCAQVGKLAASGDSHASDGGIYPKWAQALSSCVDLVWQCTARHQPSAQNELTAIIPFLVVPDGTLWQVNYDNDGTQITEPVNVERVSYWVNRPLVDRTTDSTSSDWFSISHLEICTLSALVQVLDRITEDASEGLLSTRTS